MVSRLYTVADPLKSTIYRTIDDRRKATSNDKQQNKEITLSNEERRTHAHDPSRGDYNAGVSSLHHPNQLVVGFL